jgi:ABC-type polysaccharide/polyol phosphate transport system ATPase subunit
MADDIVVRVEGLGKKFCRTLRRSMYYGAIDVMRSMVGLSSYPEVLRRDEFWAVDHVTFALRRGETLGLIGANGSGKSTLLRLLAGIYQPDAGRIEIKGRVSALIALGAGFHPMMTGRENIYLGAAILGMSRRETDRKFNDIVDFADIGHFLDSPIKTYSSGMHLRLGFAIAIFSEPDILLVDEALAVGDASFQKKCLEKALRLIREGTAMILVSHATPTVERLCNNGLMLKQGRQIYWGPVEQCVQRYFHEIGQDNLTRGATPQTFGVGDVRFSNVHVYQEGRHLNDANVEFGAPIIIEFEYKFLKPTRHNNQVRVGIRTFEGREVQKIIFQERPCSQRDRYPNEHIIPLKEEGRVRVRIGSPRLFPQTFRVDLAISPLDMDLHLGGLANAALFNVVHPRHERTYLEYGNLTITEFDYDVAIS